MPTRREMIKYGVYGLLGALGLYGAYNVVSKHVFFEHVEGSRPLFEGKLKLTDTDGKSVEKLVEYHSYHPRMWRWTQRFGMPKREDDVLIVKGLDGRMELEFYDADGSGKIGDNVADKVIVHDDRGGVMTFSSRRFIDAYGREYSGDSADSVNNAVMAEARDQLRRLDNCYGTYRRQIIDAVRRQSTTVPCVRKSS